MAVDPNRRKDKRPMPYDDQAGQEAFRLASRSVAQQDRKATPKRGRGTESPSGRGLGGPVGRGAIVRPQVEDNGGTKGKSIPISICTPPRVGQLDDYYLEHFRGRNPVKRPPTKYDSTVHIDNQSNDGLGTQVKLAREENPYLNPKCVAIDYRFWSPFHFNFYKSVILNKNKIMSMQWVDWDHIERKKETKYVEQLLQLVEKHKIKHLMGFSHD
jgi:hypothetical protein